MAHAWHAHARAWLGVGTTPLVAMVTDCKEQNGSVCEAMGEPSKHTAGRSGRFEVSLPSLDVWKFKLCRHVCLCPVNREAEAHRVEEYNAAVTIQSWFRGCRLRTHLK